MPLKDHLKKMDKPYPPSAIEPEIEKREKALYECALAIEKDSTLQQAMKDWDITLQDGLSNDWETT